MQATTVPWLRYAPWGAAGVPVVTVDPAFLAPGRYSRYSSLRLRFSPFESPDWSDWLLAIGRTGPRRAIYATRRDQGQGLAFCNRFGLSLTLATHRAFGKMTSKEAALWRRWRTDRGDDIVDAVRDTDDPFPALIESTSTGSAVHTPPTRLPPTHGLQEPKHDLDYGDGDRRSVATMAVARGRLSSMTTPMSRRPVGSRANSLR